MRKLFLTWQDKKSRKWYPVAQLTFDGELYRFGYLHGVNRAQEEANFQPIVSFPDFNKVYESSALFPMFANRVMPSTRPEYKQTIEWLALPENINDPLAFIARTGGAKVTDNFEMFCAPELDEERNYILHFFAHGLRYLPECSRDRIATLSQGDKVYLALDFQNPFEANALQLHTRDNHIVGYCPSYLLDDVLEIVKRNEVEVCVERVNDQQAPLQFRLLCRLVFPKLVNYEPFHQGNFEPVATLNKTIEEHHLAFT